MKNIWIKIFSISFVSLSSMVVFAAPGDYRSDAESPLGLYGTMDLDVANEFLSPQGLTAVEVMPGKALTGFSMIHFERASFEGGPTLTQYEVNALPFLVDRKDGSVRKAYYFAETRTNSPTLVQISQAAGAAIGAAKLTFRLGQNFPYAGLEASGSLENCPATWGCTDSGQFTQLNMGAATASQFLPTSDSATLQLPLIGPVMPFGQVVQQFVATGAEYRRPFNQAQGDRYWVAPGTVQGELFRRGHFKPTQWSISHDVTVVVDRGQVLPVPTL